MIERWEGGRKLWREKESSRERKRAGKRKIQFGRK